MPRFSPVHLPDGFLFTEVATPDGSFALLAAHGALVSCGWSEGPTQLLPRIHASLLTACGEEVSATAEALRQAAQAVASYYADPLSPALREVPLKQTGGDFTGRAWQRLADIAPGDTVSYAQLAALAGNPRAYRAAANACARNALPLFIPCHRVTATGGALGGFRYGSAIKTALLEREDAAYTALHPVS
ncbi:methylated-DNA--[protein]-cysteine S-methyltransferase [Dermabacteraceae bacterium P7074]